MSKLLYIRYVLIFTTLFTSTSLVYGLEINLSRSKLVQLALHLEVADKQLQYDFSRIAIIEMLLTYQQELQRSQKSLININKNSSPINSKKKIQRSAKIRRWQIATQSYLNTLEQYLFLMDSGVAIDFLISKQNKIIILLGKQPVIISGSNAGADKQIEQNIVEQFCLQYDCIEYFKKTHANTFSNARHKINEHSPSEKNSIAYEELSGSWEMHSNLQADFIVSNGLTFNFSNIKNKALKQQWAIGISQELSQLDQHLQTVLQKGNKIQWSSFKILPLPLTDNAYKILINSNEDYIKIGLPLLGENQTLFKRLNVWIQNYFENKTDYPMTIKADRYFPRNTR